MDEEINDTVEHLRAAGTDPSKQVPPLVKLGDWYLKKAKTTSNGADFTKANALYNAALVRSRSVNHEIDEDQILRRIVDTFREFFYAFANDKEEISVNEIRHEINSHKEFLANERRIFKERVDKIDSCFNTKDKTEDEYKIHADQVHDVFRDIQDMYIRLVSMLAKECESRLGKPPCDYAIIALGSVARMEATPFSDLEFAILYSDPDIGDKISYFRVLSHFLHLKVINLGETILPALGIEELNNFQSSDANSTWFYDLETPRGVSFDGAMPWASKTPLGRMATKNKPALELIRTPEEMAKFQDEEIAVKEGYHLADIMSRVALLYGDEALLNEYNERVAEKLNAKSSVTEEKSTETVGVIRGMQQMMLDVERYAPRNSYLSMYFNEGALFDAKKQFYRLISLLLSDLGMIFDIRSPSPWQVISELQTRGIIDECKLSVNIKVCLSIANEIRLKTYFANNGQRELFSPVPQYANITDQAADVPIFRDFDEDVLVHLLSTSFDIYTRCDAFCLKWIQQGKINDSIFRIPSLVPSKALLLGTLYFRLHNSHKALEWMKSESKDSPYYVYCLCKQGYVYLRMGEYEKSIEYFEEALQGHYQNEQIQGLFDCYIGLATAVTYMKKYKMAIVMLKEAICRHSEIYGKGSQTLVLAGLMQLLGLAYIGFGDLGLAAKTCKEVEEMCKGLTNVPDERVFHLAANMADTLSYLDQHAQALGYLERALQLGHKVFGKDNLSASMARIYYIAGTVYGRVNLNDKALSFFKRSLEFYQLLFGDDPHPGKIDVLRDLGTLFSRRYQTTEAMENLKSSLEQARALYHEKPHLVFAETLNNMGVALSRAEKFEESLAHFQEAIEIMDEILGPNHSHPFTSEILYNMGTLYYEHDDLSKARQCLKNALSINSVLYGEDSISGNMEAVSSNLAITAETMGIYSEAKEYYTKALKITKKISLANNTCPSILLVVVSLYRLSSTCGALGEQDEALKHLEEAREIAKNAGLKHWMVVNILVQLIKKYAKMESINKSIICYLEAREIAKSLPKDNFISTSTLDMLKLMKI